ncbi:hypothetical protein APTSU1_000948600 [Apodemus speciosus]|uniref:Uncharacterized protein n=1 Tax=Apodemus speciosus TaxID=105296 RepID=A0ABQ0F4Q2_APOSI
MSSCIHGPRGSGIYGHKGQLSQAQADPSPAAPGTPQSQESC